ncbi:MAG: bifunctional phosphoribosylaminoimidazolecarboxamide formyltransferase/IMP cyclohydrolase [Nitrospirae bacterium]|nr:bifunctional phosphoribosylaminoimidazolecarboxamide formyltransferase/IMP cyclohydrolase [Nitrospirota bacterium]
MAKVKRALISVSDKTGVIDFASKLAKMGVEILSTGGTAKAMRDAKVAVKDVSEFTGFPEMLDGRVKTLHPKVHGGLLGRRGDKSHVAQMKEHGIEAIDMVVVNLYPFEATIKKDGCGFEDAIENIDIGGPAMIRSASKNFMDVVVIVDPADYDAVAKELKDGAVSPRTRFRLAAKAYEHTAKYDTMISSFFKAAGAIDTEYPFFHKSEMKTTKSRPYPEAVPAHFSEQGKADSPFPIFTSLPLIKVQDLRYGENPHQRGAFYREPVVTEPSVVTSCQLQGKAMSFNNYLDANSALELAKEFTEPVSVIIKHNNPCGVATADRIVDAYVRAREIDPVSAFGGVLAFNRKVDAATAKEITSTFVEVVIAPGFDRKALELFKKKDNIRLLDIGSAMHGTASGFDMKRVVGGMIIQERDLGMIGDIKKLKVVTKRKPTAEEYKGLAFAWKVAKHVKSNAIIYSYGTHVIGIGAGQMSRVDSTRLGALKSNFPTKGACLASDAFFPFRDGIDECAKHGVTAIIEPGGSLKDPEVIAAANEYGIAMVFTGMRHFRH